MKNELHSRNKHINGYDFDILIESNPELKSYTILNPKGQQTINFSNAIAVKELNKALLLAYYNIEYWDLPKGHLCPPIPGRVDYIHHIADLLNDKIPHLKSDNIKGLDIGTGANLIYPLLGHAEYNWKFVGSEINNDSIASAKTILVNNPKLTKEIKIRKQKNKQSILEGLIQTQERFDFTMCNPPFHSSEEEALQSNQIKSKKLGIKETMNFGGVHSELWCDGGELAFIKRMAFESQRYSKHVKWFTSLVSKKENLASIYKQLDKLKAIHKTIEMAQGNKQSRMVAWKFKKIPQLEY